MIKKHYKTIIIFLIIVLGFFLRIYRINYAPPSLNWDEAAIGYNAYSLLETGKDEYGYSWPLMLRSFDDYKPPVYSYLTMIPISFLGLNELSVRLISILSGTISILLVYLLGKRIFNEKSGIFAAFLFAIQPWSIHFFRVAFEASVALPFTLSGIYLMYLAKDKKSFSILLLSLTLTVISSYAYFANRALFLPTIIITLIYNRDLLRSKDNILKSIGLTILLSAPVLYLMLSGQGLARFHNTSIFRILDNFEGGWFSLTNNRLYYLLSNVFARYLSYFSPVNLFVRGTPEPIQSIHGFSVFFPVQIVFVIAGIYSLQSKYKKYSYFLIFLLLFPIPAAFTWNWFSTVRVLPYFTFLTIIAGFGVVKLLQFINKYHVALKIAIISSFLIILLNSFAVLMTTLFLYTPYSEKGDWQFGFREIMQEIKPYYEDYDQVILETGHAQPHIFSLLYLKYDPEKYHESIGCPDCVDIPRFNWDFGNIKFRKIYWPDDRNLKNTLFIGNEFNLPIGDVHDQDGAEIIKEVHDFHGSFVARVVSTED